jgi:hypothetical protein
MSDCTGAINGLLKYATNNFPNQVQLQDVKTLSTFPIGFAKLQDIQWLGLQNPASLVTKNISDMRQTLASNFLLNQYYANRLSYLAVTSKLPWVKSSVLYQLINKNLQIAQENV